FHLRSIPGVEEPISFTYGDRVIEAALDGFKTVQAEELKAIHLPTPAEGTRRYFYFVAPLYPLDLRKIGDRIEAGLKLDPSKDSFNLLAMTAPMGPHTENVPVMMLLVQALSNGFPNVLAHARGLPLPAPAVSLSAPPHSSTVNGLVPVGAGGGIQPR